MNTTTIIRNLAELSLDAVVEPPQEYDVFFGFLCSEVRSTHVLARAQDRCVRRVMFYFNNSGPAETDRYRTWAKRVEAVELNAKDGRLTDTALEDEVVKLLNVVPSGRLPRVLIDISSMPRVVMAALLTSIFDSTGEVAVELTVAYCLAKYVPPPSQHSTNVRVRPVHPRFTGFATNPGLPVASVVGLGYEKGKALGAVEYIQSADWWVFVPTSEETRYIRKVKDHNGTILNVVKDEQKFEYSVHSPLTVLTRLESLVADLSRTYKPVLLPFGPKIFFFCALLTALVHRSTAIWDVIGEPKISRHEVNPSPYVMCMKMELAQATTI